MNTQSPMIEIAHVKVELGGMPIHKDINLIVNQSEILGVVGSSGSGKTTLLREILMLQPPDSGSIRIFGQEVTTATPENLLKIQRRSGTLFQQNALFSSLTVLENVMFPLQEQISLSQRMMRDLALLKISLVGLPIEASIKYPAELSGGMQKRAALARAIALDPELLFLDEPTTGLDPDSAASLDELIVNLKTTMGLTIVMVTHDLDTLWRVTDRVAFLDNGKVLIVDEIEKLASNPNPLLQKFFNGPRGRTVKNMQGQEG
ncbi:MAG: ATP-binding cassette domain-containing protein [Gammaproteobacteria bacterium]|nr:ATP-binding cassette domain-containing protein [Gammaproteobacteria bacterium]